MFKKTIFVCFIISLITCVGCKLPDTFLIKTISQDSGLEETVVAGQSGWFIYDKIAIINIDGDIVNSAPGSLLGGGGENPVSVFKEKLNRAAKDDDVKAVILRINSPGGTVTASDMMYNMLMEFRRKTNKPVVTCMLDVAASGGYYIACGSDHIIASPTTITGSIGTLMQSFSIEGTLRILGVKAITFKSGEMKDAGSPVREMQDNEKEYFQSIIMTYYEQFLKVVKDGRPNLSEKKIRELADGRVYIGKEALSLGLVDAIGYPDDAIRWAWNKANLKKASVVMYHRPYQPSASVYSTNMKSAGNAPSMVNIINIDLPGFLKNQSPGFWYLWSPDLK